MPEAEPTSTIAPALLPCIALAPYLTLRKAPKTYCHDPPPIAEITVQNRPGLGDASACHEEVQAGDSLEKFNPILFASDIQVNAARTVSYTRRTDRIVAIGSDHTSPFFQKCLGDRLANFRGCAGYESRSSRLTHRETYVNHTNRARGGLGCGR